MIVSSLVLRKSHYLFFFLQVKALCSFFFHSFIYFGRGICVTVHVWNLGTVSGSQFCLSNMKVPGTEIELRSSVLVIGLG